MRKVLIVSLALLLLLLPLALAAQTVNNVFIQYRNTTRRTVSVPGFPVLTLDLDALGVYYGSDPSGTHRVIQWCVMHDAAGNVWFGVPETITAPAYAAFYAIKINPSAGDVLTDPPLYCGR